MNDVSQVINPQPALSSHVKSLYDVIRVDLERAEEILRNELRNDSSFVDELLQYGGQLGGKRLRPALLLLVAQAVGQIQPEHHTLAAVVEMIHTATLVHDDVLDEADLRRHLATVNSRWNNETSVLLGDYLFTHAFYLASTLDSTYACRRIGRSTNLVCEGELRQIGHRGNHALPEDEYLEIINGKTAELCACACHLGAKYAQAPEPWINQLESFGRALGMAFQIADDLLDLIGDESATGKSLGTDLEKCKPTLPLIRVHQLATDQERRDWVALIEGGGPDVRRQVNTWLERFDALAYARQKAGEFASQARDQLQALPPSAAKTVLWNLTDFVVNRSL
jgi:octaprenyl-diphosphate synthase